MSKARSVGVVAVVVVMLVMFGLVAKRPAAPADLSWLTYTHAGQVDYWTGRISTLGADAAYKEFASQVSDTADNHEKAHAFGGALYQAVGLAGITTCDFHFQYGCFHEFIGKAVAEHGVSILSQIDTACAQAIGPSGCRHGIGHALMYYYGYTLDGLKKSLVGCDTYTKQYPYEGCYAGVFMEFNTQIMLGDDGKMRPLAHDDYVYPCAELDTKYQAVCAYHQTRWWNNMLGLKGSDEDYVRLGGLCRSLGLGDKARLACFAGLGVLAGDLGSYKKAAPASLCDAAGSSPAERLACRSVAAAFIYSTTYLGADAALEGCKGLHGDALAYCTQYTTDKALFVYLKPLPQAYGATF